MRLHWSWDRGGPKDPSGANLYIKFEVNLIPLTPLSVVHKFNKFISNKNIDHRFNNLVHPNLCKFMEFGAYKGLVNVRSIWMDHN